MNKPGVIEILANPSFPEFAKSRYADDIVKRSSNSIGSEYIPFSFYVYATHAEPLWRGLSC